MSGPDMLMATIQGVGETYLVGCPETADMRNGADVFEAWVESGPVLIRVEELQGVTFLAALAWIGNRIERDVCENASQPLERELSVGPVSAGTPGPEQLRLGTRVRVRNPESGAVVFESAEVVDRPPSWGQTAERWPNETVTVKVTPSFRPGMPYDLGDYPPSWLEPL